MKKLSALSFLFLAQVAFGASTTPVPQDQGLKQVYVVDQNGNGLLDQSNSLPALSVSLGSTVAKSVIGKTASATTSSVNAVNILSYTTTTGKTFYITGYEIEGRLTSPSATAAALGTCSLQLPAGTTIATYNFMNPTHGAVDRVVISPAEPLANTSGVGLNISCAPAATTSTLWQMNVMGYEK